MRRLIGSLLLAAFVVPALAPANAQVARTPTHAPFTVRETGQGFDKLQDALMSIRGQDATILIAPGIYRQCAIQQAGHIVFHAVQPGTVIFDGVACEDKAALVLRGASSTVEGIIFRNMRVRDGNGAGIRIEIGDLTVTDSMFLDSQEGILGGTDDPAKVTIDHSTFSGLGQCDETPDCAHSIYLASTGVARVTNSRFERGRGGHYVKLRIPVVAITGNSFDDSQGHKTNYAIDLPEGATGLIARNTFVQGPDKENWTGIIVVAAEHRKYHSAGLRVEDNVASLAPGQTKNPGFVVDASHEKLLIGANRLGAGVRPFELR